MNNKYLFLLLSIYLHAMHYTERHKYSQKYCTVWANFFVMTVYLYAYF